MPKKLKSGKKGKQAQLTLDAASAESGSIDSQPYVEQLREKFMKHHDPSIMLPQNERLSLEWRDITYRVPVVKRRCCKTIEKREKAILQNVSGYLPSGSLLGILGPSGAGKTTFLNILSRKLRSKKITGEVTLNNTHASRHQFQHLSGFVAQDDVLMGSLTCEEALLFAARLKLPNSIPEEKQIATARALLRNLGLEHVKDHLIGYTGAASRNSGLARGLSGGERKRVSVCFEMVSNPKILFLDEPTSGLDSFAAKAVMENLRDLAFYGRTIVATIHQPSAEIFRMFDYLLLLAEGQTVFYGPAHLAISHFESLGIRPPLNINPADFLLKAIHVPSQEALKAEEEQAEAHELMLSRSRELQRSNGSIAADQEMEDLEAANHAVSGLRAATHEQVKKLLDGYKTSVYAEDVADKLGLEMEDVDLNGDVAHDKRKTKKSKSRKTMEKRGTIERLDIQVPSGYTASYFKQFRLLSVRAFRNLVREPALLRSRLFQSISLALLAGLIWLRLKKTQAGASDRYSSAFFVMTSAVFGALNGPTFVFPSERGVFFREKSSNMYSTGIYYLTKYVAELPSNIILPFISMTITYWMIGYNDSPIPWLIMCGFCILLNIVGHAVGMLLTCAILDTSVVIKVQPLIVLPLMLFSGFFLNSDSVKKYFIWLDAISFLKYAFRASCVAIFSKGKKLVFDCPGGACRFRDGADVLTSLDFNNHPIWKDAVILLGMGTAVHILAFIALYIHTKRL